MPTCFYQNQTFQLNIISGKLEFNGLDRGKTEKRCEEVFQRSLRPLNSKP